jgi:anthranilate synthase component 1
MEILPDFATFAGHYGRGQSQVLWTALNADLDTPVSAILKIAGGRPYSFLLESVEGGTIRGRYSFIGAAPDLIWRCFGSQVEINQRPAERDSAFSPCPAAADGDVLGSLRALVKDSLIDLPPHLPPMAAGLVGYLGYDMVRLVERLPLHNPDRLGVPDAVLLRPSIVAVFDNLTARITIVTPVRPDSALAADQAYDQAAGRLATAVAALDQPLRSVREPAALPPPPAAVTSNIGREDYCDRVRTAKDYIMAGDIFQVVLSQRFSVPFTLEPFSLYRALRRINPSPFLFYLDFGDFVVTGSSPEILVRVRNGKVVIRPIAGTRPRGADEDEDRRLAAELLADPKELAEHLMLLDLGRNDAGRVAKVGTVRVTEKMIIERYSHVMHVVSNVEGQLDPAFDPLDALFCGFPAGTVSGAPKVRAMEIIDELEPDKRGIYGGCIGYLGANGDLDTCIALRTAVLKDGILHVQAGGGIVADSDPDSEFRECENKARALIRAAEEAVSFAPAGLSPGAAP